MANARGDCSYPFEMAGARPVILPNYQNLYANYDTRRVLFYHGTIKRTSESAMKAGIGEWVKEIL